MFCRKCGAQIGEGEAFCGQCGSRVETPSATGTAHAPTAPGQTVGGAPWPAPGQKAPQQQPYAYAPVPPHAAARKQTGLIVGLIAGGVLLLALLVFLGIRFLGNDEDPNATGKSTGKETTAESTAKLYTFALGEAGVFEGLAIVVDQVTRPDDEHLYSKPAEDHEHILIWYTFENRSKSNLRTPKKTSLYIVSGEDNSTSSGYDMTSYDAEAEYYTSEGVYEPNTELAPGETTSGWLIYQKPIKNTKVTLHYYSEFINRAPDLVYEFPVVLGENNKPGETTQTAPPTTTPATTTTEVLTYNLEELLPGQWAAMPGPEFYTYAYAFRSDGLFGSTFAYSEAEETLDNWTKEDVWQIDPYIWNSWRIEGDLLVFQEISGDVPMTVKVEHENKIILGYTHSTEEYPLYRLADEPGLSDYLVGTWIPDEADEEGVYAALSFMPDGQITLTGATKADEAATVDDWGNNAYWEVLGTIDGTWTMEDDNLILSLQGTDDTYIVIMNGPNNCIIQFEEFWADAYSRVLFPG
jgi:hypothetical protein